jgi:hypothetical protein
MEQESRLSMCHCSLTPGKETFAETEQVKVTRARYAVA